MVQWKLKACPRCGGDTFMERDMDGWFLKCIQCSHEGHLVPRIISARARGGAPQHIVRRR